MPWGSDLPTRVRTHRAAWFNELTALNKPPHQEAWKPRGTQANIPAAAASASMPAPSAKSSVVAHMPATGDSFPHEFPWQFATAHGSMAAHAEMLAPSVGVGVPVVSVPTMSATAAMFAPSVSITTIEVLVEPPAMTATAEMPPVDMAAVVQVPVMQASAATNGFPYQFPRSFAPNGMHTPTVSADLFISVVLMTASAGATAPDVLATMSVAAVVMTAAASASVPLAASGAGAGLPIGAGTAEMPTPTIIWTQPPVTTPFVSNGTFDVAAARAAGYTHLDLVPLGGGGAGNGGGAGFNVGGGGGAGAFGTATIALADYPALTTLNVIVGAAVSGPSSGVGSNGNASSVSGSGIPTVTGAGGTGGLGEPNDQNGYGGGTQDYNGITYGPRGAGGTGNAGAGTAPGAGGAGGNGVFLGSSPGGGGSRGQVWITAYRP